MKVNVIQFIRPDGKQVMQETDLSDDLKDKYELVRRSGLHFTAEAIGNGLVTLCLDHPVLEDDYDMEIVSNGPGVQSAMETMLGRFSEEEFGKWAKEHEPA